MYFQWEKMKRQTPPDPLILVRSRPCLFQKCSEECRLRVQYTILSMRPLDSEKTLTLTIKGKRRQTPSYWSDCFTFFFYVLRISPATCSIRIHARFRESANITDVDPRNYSQKHFCPNAKNDKRQTPPDPLIFVRSLQFFFLHAQKSAGYAYNTLFFSI